MRTKEREAVSLLNLSPAEFCDATEACAEGRDWAINHPTMVDVWDNCRRSDWLLWLADKLDRRPDDRTLRLFAVWCARSTPLPDGRKTGDLLTDPRSLAALEVAERFAHGKATLDELNAARDAARDAWGAQAAKVAEAVEAAEAAALATATAAEAAALAAAWATEAAGAAEAVARDAARDAALAAAWDADGYVEAARDAALATQAAYFRTLMPNPFRKEAQP